MKTELLYLVWVTVLTALLWVPYILDRMATWGLADTVGYPASPKPQSPWATRVTACAAASRSAFTTTWATFHSA